MKRIGLLGFGSVGSAFYELLTTHPVLKNKYEITSILVHSTTKKRPDAIISLLRFDRYEFLSGDFDVLIDASYGNQPAEFIITECLKRKIHVVSANKEVVELHFYEFIRLAKANKVAFQFEASTVSGIPIIHTLLELVQEDDIMSVFGILNGSTNFCLSKVFHEGMSLSLAILEAKRLGYLESDPTQDMDGFDSLRKIIILSNLAYKTEINQSSCFRVSLSTISENMITFLKENGHVLKYIASSNKEENGISVVVEPVAVLKEHYIAQIHNETNLICVFTKNRGMLSWIGKGAGGKPTASALMSDLLQIDSGMFQYPETEEISMVRSVLPSSLEQYFIEYNKPINHPDLEEVAPHIYRTEKISKAALTFLIESSVGYCRIENES